MLLLKLCCAGTGKPTGYDRVRNTEIGNKDFELEVLEEAYTTEHWLVRIYKVKDLTNRGNWHFMSLAFTAAKSWWFVSTSAWIGCGCRCWASVNVSRVLLAWKLAYYISLTVTIISIIVFHCCISSVFIASLWRIKIKLLLVSMVNCQVCYLGLLIVECDRIGWVICSCFSA